MNTALTVLLVATCAVLTVALIGTLRGIAELRLLLTGAAQTISSDRLMPGRELPDELRQRLSRPSSDGLILFLAAGCPGCTRLAQLTSSLRVPNIAAAIVGSADGLRELLRSDVEVLDPDTSSTSAEKLQVDVFPFVVHQRDGVIVGAAYGDGVESTEGIETLWAAGGGRLMEVTA